MNGVVVQPDGKILVVGDFRKLAGFARNHIARLNPDGSIDTTFNPEDGVAGGFSSGSPTYETALDIQVVALQRDGKILIGGRFTLVNNLPFKGIARLRSDGTVDPKFLATGVTEGPFDPVNFTTPNLAYVSSILVQPDDRILIAGPFSRANDVARSCVARLNADGTLDPSFDPGLGLRPAPGRPLLNATFYLARDLDGAVIVQGYFARAFEENIARFGLARFNSNGALDPDFKPVIEPADWTTQPHSLVLEPDGEIVLAGSFTNVNSILHPRIARLHRDGSLDPNFNPPPIPNLGLNATGQPDGELIVYGGFTNIAGVDRPGLARLNHDGTLDPNFDPGTGPHPGPGTITEVAFTPQGDLVVAGTFVEFDGASRDGIALLYDNDPRLPRLAIRTVTLGKVRLSIRTQAGQIYLIESTDSLFPPS